MAPDIDCSVQKSKLLTMDVVELTLLLKSIGFRLESIDYDEFRSWSKKSGSVGNSATTIEPVRAEADHYINVEISCSKSKMVSNLSLKTNETETTATDAPHTTTDSAKSVICTCPKREPRKDSNSFWEVQSSGTFANQRRCSVNALMNSETGIDHDTSSNLLPTLSTKSIALTQVLAQVLLNQYKSNSPFDESSAKNVDVTSIIRTIESINAASTLANEKVGDLPSVSQTEDLNLITPLSSMNVTPPEREGLMNVTIPKVVVNDPNADELIGTNTALNETVNTEAFSSPKSDLVTSSPHPSLSHARYSDGESNIINHLTRARQSIDQALMSVRLNVTRNLTQDMAAPLLTTTLDSQNSTNLNRSNAPRMLNGRNATQVATNARPPLSTLNRRASLGSVSRVAAKSVVASPSLMSRLNGTKPINIERSTASSKLALVRRAVSSIGNGTMGNVKTPTQITVVKQTSSISRRSSSPSIISNGTPPLTGLAVRKTASSTKIVAVPSKLAKK